MVKSKNNLQQKSREYSFKFEIEGCIIHLHLIHYDMAIQQITPAAAKDLLDGDEEYVYIDVRSEAEFQQGRPKNSVNIPIKQMHQERQMLVDNPDFLKVVQANFSASAKLILGCAMGQRSYMACQVLAQDGYQNLLNVDGGFTGVRDMSGNVIKQGWVQACFPVEQGDGKEKSYQSLKAGK